MKFTEHNSILTLSADVGEVRVHDFQQRSMHGNATAASLSRRVKEDRCAEDDICLPFLSCFCLPYHES